MNLQDPSKAVAPTLDGAVLAVLYRAAQPLTIGEIFERMPRGSEIGARKCVSRLIDQGIVRSTRAGRTQVHELNRSHVAADVARILAEMRETLIGRMRSSIERWHVKPIYAALFGSLARGEGNEESDVDLIVVHRPLPGEQQRLNASVRLQTAWFADPLLSERQRDAWDRQLDRLRTDVHSWCGNELQIVDTSLPIFLDTVRRLPLGEALRQEALDLFVAPLYGRPFASTKAVPS